MESGGGVILRGSKYYFLILNYYMRPRGGEAGKGRGRGRGRGSGGALDFDIDAFLSKVPDGICYISVAIIVLNNKILYVRFFFLVPSEKDPLLFNLFRLLHKFSGWAV